MKRHILLFCLALCSHAAFSQSNLIFFSDENEPFYLSINAALQNPDPATNVVIENFNSDVFKVTVDFVNEALPTVNKTLMVTPNTESTLRIFTKKNGKIGVRLFNEVPLFFFI